MSIRNFKYEADIVMLIKNLKIEYEQKKISKYEYLSQVCEYNKVLFDYFWLMENSIAKSINIDKDRYKVTYDLWRYWYNPQCNFSFGIL